MNRAMARKRSEENTRRYLAYRDSSPPAILYKYMAVGTARKALCKRTLRWSSPLLFNDPFDAQWDIFWQRHRPEFQGKMQHALREMLTGSYDWSRVRPELKSTRSKDRVRLSTLSPLEKEREVSRLTSEYFSPQAPDDTKAELTKLVRDTRVLCLTEIADCLLMWAHYGQQHRGVLLGFDVHQLEEAWLPVLPVRYRSELPRILDEGKWIDAVVYGESGSDSILPEGIEDYSTTKATVWEYEHEWRFFHRLRQGTGELFNEWPFPPGALRSITTGCRCEENESKDLCSLARSCNSAVEVAQLRQHDCDFRLVRSVR